MRKLNRWIIFSISLIVLLVLTAFAVPTRGILATGTPGGFLSLQSGTFTDSLTGDQYTLTALGGEGQLAGGGNFTLGLQGPISLCSTHGGGADIGTPLEDGNYAGNFPLTEIQCGTAFGMAVSIDGCTAKSEMHGYSHSDWPFYTYTGSTTIEFVFKKSGTGGQVNVKIYTPKGPIKLAGEYSGPVIMDTCP